MPDFFKSDKGVRIITLAGIAVMVIIFLVSLSGNGGKKEEQNVQTDFFGYEERLEKQLGEILEQIEGAGEIKVMITLERTEENVLSDRETLVKTTITPTVRGVIVYCSGSRDVLVRQKVLEAASKCLGVGSNRICVTY